MMTKYYLRKTSNRLIQDVRFWEKENKIPKDVADNLVNNIEVEYKWSVKKLEQKFSWTFFHKQLDLAMANWMNEGPVRIESMRLPGNITLLEFAEYSNKMRKKESEDKT